MADFIIVDDVNKETKNISNDDMKNPNMSLMEKLNMALYKYQSIKIQDKVVFYRLMSTMLNAGTSLIKSIDILERQEKNPVMKNILQVFGKHLKEGRNLSDCMEMYPKSFPPSEIGVVRAGEKTGQLNTSLLNLATQVEKVASMSGKLKSALIYPAAILLVVIGVVVVLLTMVVPKLLEIFADKSALPPTTQMLLSISDIIKAYWGFILAGLVGLFVLFKLWKRTPSGIYNYDKIIMKMPVFGQIIKKGVLSKFSRVFAGLIGSGVSIVESLRITADAVGNEVYRQRILLLSENVKRGMKIWESLDGDDLFPDMMVQMIQVGEQTAKLDSTITKVADFYDEQVDNTVSNINKLLEPFIIVFLAITVGFIAVAIMQPIMNLADTISQ